MTHMQKLSAEKGAPVLHRSMALQPMNCMSGTQCWVPMVRIVGRTSGPILIIVLESAREM